MNFSEQDIKIGNAVATAVIGVDTGLGGDINNISGVFKTVGDSFYSGLPLPAIYHEKDAAKIRNLNQAIHYIGISGYSTTKQEKNYNNLRKKWLKNEEHIERPIEVLEAVADSEPHAFRQMYLNNLATALRANANLARSDLGLEEQRSYKDLVTATLGRKPELADPKPYQEKLHPMLVDAGFDPDKHEGLCGAVDAWRKAQTIVPREEVRSYISEALHKVEASFRVNVLPHFSEPIREKLINTPFDRYILSELSNVFFMGSSTYQSSRQPFCGHLEFNIDVQRTREGLDALAMHEEGHHGNSVIYDVLIREGFLGPEAGVFTMMTPSAALAEGLAEATRDIFVEPANFTSSQRMASLLQEMDSVGRGNVGYKRYEEGIKEDQPLVEYFRESWCVDEEHANRIVKKWLPNKSLGITYLPAYTIGPSTVRKALERHEDRSRVIEMLYGLNSNRAVPDVVTFPQMVERDCMPE